MLTRLFQCHRTSKQNFGEQYGLYTETQDHTSVRIEVTLFCDFVCTQLDNVVRMETFFREELFLQEDSGSVRPNKGVEVMLVLSRKSGERILIGDDIKITIVRIGPNSVRIGVDAPGQYTIVREELCHEPSHSTASLVDSPESIANPPTLPR